MSIANLPLENKVAIVTGGGTRIGQAIALEFAKAGADVVVASRKLANLEKVAKEVRAGEILERGESPLSYLNPLSGRGQGHSLLTFSDMERENEAAVYSRFRGQQGGVGISDRILC